MGSFRHSENQPVKVEFNSSKAGPKVCPQAHKYVRRQYSTDSCHFLMQWDLSFSCLQGPIGTDFSLHLLSKMKFNLSRISPTFISFKRILIDTSSSTKVSYINTTQCKCQRNLEFRLGAFWLTSFAAILFLFSVFYPFINQDTHVHHRDTVFWQSVSNENVKK